MDESEHATGGPVEPETATPLPAGHACGMPANITVNVHDTVVGETDIARMPIETGRRVVITWPRAGHAAVLANATMRIRDAETGEEFVDGTALTMRLGEPGNWTHGPIAVDVCRLTGTDGEPLGSRQVVKVDGEIPRAWFHYDVAEMRIAEA
jgi:hypothetical protein